jgi:Negative regulator of sigma F
MSQDPTKLDAALRALGNATPPAPSAALEALVRDTRPVSVTRPARTALLLMLASLALLAVHVHSHDVRHDYGALPGWWFWTMAGAWAATYAAALSLALVPRAGAMLVESRRAKVAAFVVPAIAIVLTVVLRIDAPPATKVAVPLAQALEELEWCLVTGLEMTAVPFALGLLVVRRAALPLDVRWIGATVGAANGALAGLMLHIHCNVGGAMHTGVAHAGQVVLGALLGALIVPRVVAARES